MQTSEAFQFGQNSCVEWRRFYSMSVRKIQLQFLESTGPIPLPNVALNYVQDTIRRITYQRAKQEDPKVLKQWFETVRKAIQEHGIHEDDIWNFDETGFAIGLCTTSKVITAAERSERPRTVIQEIVNGSQSLSV